MGYDYKILFLERQRRCFRPANELVAHSLSVSTAPPLAPHWDGDPAGGAGGLQLSPVSSLTGGTHSHRPARVQLVLQVQRCRSQLLAAGENCSRDSSRLKCLGELLMMMKIHSLAMRLRLLYAFCNEHETNRILNTLQI